MADFTRIARSPLPRTNRKQRPRTQLLSPKKIRRQKGHQGICRPNCGQRVEAAQHAPHDQRIRDIIQLLQHIPRNHRQREQQQCPRNAPLCQISIHKSCLPSPPTIAQKQGKRKQGRRGDSGGEAASLRVAPSLPSPPLPKSSWGLNRLFLLTGCPLRGKARSLRVGCGHDG